MTDPRGRQPVGLNQPAGGGTNYPFVRPSTDIQYLLADLFVSFDDLSDEVVYPLRVAWLYNFGTVIVAPPSGWPTPTHDRDLIIVDAEDKVIFNSTLASEFSEILWDNGRLRISEWVARDNVCRVVAHNAWSQADIDDSQDQTYANYIEPINGELNGDTWYEMPKRVRSLQVGLVNIAQTHVVFGEGYNMAIEYLSDAIVPSLTLPNFDSVKKLIPGTRLTSRILLSGEAGAGLGVFPGCTDIDQYVRTINRIKGNTYQNFYYDSEGCIRTQRPVGLTNPDPREFQYASFELTQSESASAIEMLNDCQNCCECEYFARTYQGLKRQWFLHRDIAELAEATRDQYAENRDRWLVQKAIREADMLRLRVSTDGNCKISWGVAHCNASKCCLNNVTIQLTWLYYVNGILQAPSKIGFDCNKTQLDGSAQCNGPEKIVLDMDETGRHAFAFWDFSDPQTVTTLQGRHCFPDCADLEPESLKVQLHAVIYWEGSGLNPSTNLPCDYPVLEEADYPDDVKATWTELGIAVPTEGRAQKITPLLPVSDVNPFCTQCPCTEGDVSYG
jgi:hypothetical protein